MTRYFKRDEKGFTLIELLIVVAIIGILAAIAIPNLITAQRRARYSRVAGDTRTIVTQAQVLTSDNNATPGTLIAGVLAMPSGLWDGLAPNATRYMAAVNDVWAQGIPCATSAPPPVEACYSFQESAPPVGGAIGPGNVVFASWTIGADGVASNPAWNGAAAPVLDDLGNSTLLGCSFQLQANGGTIGIANPC